MIISSDQCRNVEEDLRNMLTVVDTSVIRVGVFKGHRKIAH